MCRAVADGSRHGAITYSYDQNGNETGSSDGRALSYNRRDQTTAITPAGGSAASLGYYEAGQNYLITDGAASLLYSAQGVTQRTISGVTTSYVREAGGELLSQRVGSTRYYYIHDPLGSTLALTDSAGTVSTRYSYEPYGKATSTSTTNNTRWRFADGYLSSSSGDTLMKFGQRYYDAKAGRWTQQDPLDQLGDLRQANRYGYAGNDPVNLTDPSGCGIGRFLRCMYRECEDAAVNTCRKGGRGTTAW